MKIMCAKIAKNLIAKKFRNFFKKWRLEINITFKEIHFAQASPVSNLKQIYFFINSSSSTKNSNLPRIIKIVIIIFQFCKEA